MSGEGAVSKGATSNGQQDRFEATRCSLTLHQRPDLTEQDRDQQAGDAQDHQQRSPTAQ